jgi:hypothetical protein
LCVFATCVCWTACSGAWTRVPSTASPRCRLTSHESRVGDRFIGVALDVLYCTPFRLCCFTQSSLVLRGARRRHSPRSACARCSVRPADSRRLRELPMAPSRPTMEPADLPDSSDIGGLKVRRSDKGRTKVGRESQLSELGPTGGLETDTQPVVSLAPVIHPQKLGSVHPSTVRSDESRTKVGRKSRKSELRPTGGQWHGTVRAWSDRRT